MPTAAVEAALQAQQALFREDWGAIGPLRVRMGVHTGEADKRDGYYFGSCLNHVARLMSAAHGGQILVSKTAALACSELPFQASLVDLGVHRLRDLSRGDNIYHLRHPALPSDFPPIKSEKTGNLPDAPDSLLGSLPDSSRTECGSKSWRLSQTRRFSPGKPPRSSASARTVSPVTSPTRSCCSSLTTASTSLLEPPPSFGSCFPR